MYNNIDNQIDLTVKDESLLDYVSFRFVSCVIAAL